MRKSLVHSIVVACGTVAGVGRVPFAPGTAGAVIGIPLWLVTFLAPAPALLQAALALLALVLGIWAGTRYETLTGQHDPPQFVLDETCGMLVTLIAMPCTWFTVASGFVLFRILDIAKPFPISRVQRLPGGWGIVADDVMAGLAAGLVVRVLHLQICQ
jgi:phosphatidylglycerophosphatase A